ncbi:MAG: hypothetical protein ACRDJ3_06305 [Solirubrobacteraceae bacterium]
MIRGQDGTTNTINQLQEAVILNPATGERTFLSSAELYETADHRLILDPEHTPLFSCVGPCKRAALSSNAIVLCTGCHLPSCVPCSTATTLKGEAVTLCSACERATRWKRFREWLCSTE